MCVRVVMCGVMCGYSRVIVLMQQNTPPPIKNPP